MQYVEPQQRRRAEAVGGDQLPRTCQRGLGLGITPFLLSGRAQIDTVTGVVWLDFQSRIAAKDEKADAVLLLLRVGEVDRCAPDLTLLPRRSQRW